MQHLKDSLGKPISKKLEIAIKDAISSLFVFAKKWKAVLALGKKEGLSEREMQDIVRPLLKKKLNPNQIYYLFNRDTVLERMRDQQKQLRENAKGKGKGQGQALKFQGNDGSNVMEENYPYYEQGAAGEEEEADNDEEDLEIPDNLPSVRYYSLDDLEEGLKQKADGQRKFYFNDIAWGQIGAKYAATTRIKHLYFELELEGKK